MIIRGDCCRVLGIGGVPAGTALSLRVVPWAFVSNIRLPTQRPTGRNRRRNLGTRTEGVGQGGEKEVLLREGSGSLGIQGISSEGNCGTVRPSIQF